MVVEKDFLNNLRHFFKLNLYEAKAWTALLSRGISTAGELAEIGNIPRSRAYDVLETLERKGFISMKAGKPYKYLAVQPKDVVERVKKLIHLEAAAHAKKLESAKGAEIEKGLETLYKNGINFVDAADLSTSVRGRGNLQMQMETMLKNAEKSVLIATSTKGLARKSEIFGALLQELSRNGVAVKIAAPVTKESADAVKSLMSSAEIRHAGKPESRFCIVDNKELMFMLMDDAKIHPNYDAGVWVNSPFFAEAVSEMFGAVWKDLEPADKVLKRL